MNRITLFLLLIATGILTNHLINHPPPVMSPPPRLLTEGIGFVDMCNDDLIPVKVKEAQGNLLGITAEFQPKINQSGPDFLGINRLPPIQSKGTGFMIRPGIIITARHVLIDQIISLRRAGWPFTINKDGVPEGTSYKYSFFGLTSPEQGFRKIDLSLVAMGELGKHKDYMILKANDYPSYIRSLPIGKEAHKGDIIYNGGSVPVSSAYPTINGEHSYVVSDYINCNFEGRVLKVIKNMPINLMGVSTYYNLNLNIESGYSGGPVLNSQGEVIAITIEGTRNFAYAVSINDAMELIDRKNIK